MGGGIFHLTRLLKAPSNIALNVSRDGASTASLGNLLQCLAALMTRGSSLSQPLCAPAPHHLKGPGLGPHTSVLPGLGRPGGSTGVHWTKCRTPCFSLEANSTFGQEGGLETSRCSLPPWLLWDSNISSLEQLHNWRCGSIPVWLIAQAWPRLATNAVLQLIQS